MRRFAMKHIYARDAEVYQTPVAEGLRPHYRDGFKRASRAIRTSPWVANGLAQASGSSALGFQTETIQYAVACRHEHESLSQVHCDSKVS